MTLRIVDGTMPSSRASWISDSENERFILHAQVCQSSCGSLHAKLGPGVPADNELRPRPKVLQVFSCFTPSCSEPDFLPVPSPISFLSTNSWPVLGSTRNHTSSLRAHGHVVSGPCGLFIREPHTCLLSCVTRLAVARGLLSTPANHPSS